MAGRYNEIVRIFDVFQVKNEYGENTQEWREIMRTRAAVEWSGGNRAVENDEQLHTYTRRFILRSYAQVTDTSQIEWQGHRYRVLSIERRREYNDIVVTGEQVNE